jgi:hypothetical protein
MPPVDGAANVILGRPVSDRARLGDVSQSPQPSFKRPCKLLILNGEMLERSIGHAWKAARWRDVATYRSTFFADCSTT